ncbi:class II fructose-bisphosphate aldolase [Paenibacillus senegalensis]|uniref:class II fructose-bisphosphate aldolase n=1 Tax=Paenibacillus senegalensis TaxID=1465766 RepID=UPI00047475AD|nr:class II fructose-bisphosphate aldolase [Paenibacillus senegalensis]
MNIVSSTPLLEEARQKGYGVVAINCDTLEMIQAVIEAADECEAPVIVQTTASAIKYLGMNYIVSAIKTAMGQVKVPVALHLDHGQDHQLILECIRAGYSSVMIDASMYEFDENVRRTKAVAQVARAMNINVEAELGKVGGVEDDIVVDEADSVLADPDECAKFVELTDITSLAPAIGTAHGIYKAEPNIDFARIEQIASKVKVPLVLHGGSGIPEHQLKKCVALGMSKINVGTEIKHTYANTMKQYIGENPKVDDARKYLSEARTALKNLVKEKMELVGSVGRVR